MAMVKQAYVIDPRVLRATFSIVHGCCKHDVMPLRQGCPITNSSIFTKVWLCSQKGKACYY